MKLDILLYAEAHDRQSSDAIEVLLGERDKPACSRSPSREFGHA